MRTKKNIKNSPIAWVYLMFSAGVLAEFLSLIISGGSFLTKMVFEIDYFPDYFNHIRRFYADVPNVYMTDIDACFPPLAYLYYGALARILSCFQYADSSPLQTSASGILLITMHTSLFALLFSFAMRRLSDQESALLTLLLFLSYPFWIAVERGNMTEWVLILLMYALALKDSKKAWQRELALILFATAAALKFYPAIFTLLYLMEKRWKEADRLIVYAVILFFLPFAAFDGVTGLRLFFGNITAVGSGYSGVTIAGIIGRIFILLGKSERLGHQIGRVLSLFYALIVLLLCRMNKSGTLWKKLALITSMMIVFVPECGSYCLFYWTIPFLSFMKHLRTKEMHKTAFSRSDKMYAFLFPLVFVSYPVHAFGSSGMLYLFLYLMLFILILDQVFGLVKS
ncbi:MAG: glycosyltransferase 87 family protein [Lachnospiraceae bacterium]|nr:glycosyltransferase 87 family protein [Lachnospiraceae bacterium]